MNLTLSGDNTYSFRPIFDAYLSQFRPLVPFEISTDWDRTANLVVVISSEPSRDIAGVYYELWQSFFSDEELTKEFAEVRRLGEGCRLRYSYDDHFEIKKALLLIHRKIQKSVLHNCIYGHFIRVIGIPKVRDIPEWQLGEERIEIPEQHKLLIEMLFAGGMAPGLSPEGVRRTLSRMRR